ncbi:recombinase family protein [Streptomyces sp. NPDC058411]|uniref:recombinase family protein n=1 Tax=Streptomyces sp. NPDC058411 TaxID=3346485 RepID=UPI003655C3EE
MLADWRRTAIPFSDPLSGKRWAIDETAAAVVQYCADKLINHGATLAGLTRELNEREILPPADHARKRDGQELRDGRWHSTTLRDVLYTPAVCGWLVQAVPGTKRSATTKQPALNHEGKPVSVGPEILPAEVWSAFRAIIDCKSKWARSRTDRESTSPTPRTLLRVRWAYVPAAPNRKGKGLLDVCHAC